MAQLLRELDPMLVLLVVAPLGLATAAWALRMACSFCSVDPPDFWQAAFSVVVLAIANVVLRFWLNVTDVTPSVGTQLVAPLAISAVIISMSVRTSPLSAMLVTVVHGALCVVCYIAATTVGTAMMASMVF